MFEAEVGALTVLPCACHFQPVRQHFSCYKWQAVILKARHDGGGGIYRRLGVSAPGGRILSMSTVRLLPNHPAKRRWSPLAQCARSRRPLGNSQWWAQNRVIPLGLTCTACKFCWFRRGGVCQGLTGWQICPACPRLIRGKRSGAICFLLVWSQTRSGLGS